MQEKLSVMQCHSPHSSLERPLLALLATAGLAHWWPGGLGQSLSEEEAGDRFCDSQLPGASGQARGLGTGSVLVFGKGLEVLMASLTGPYLSGLG